MISILRNALAGLALVAALTGGAQALTVDVTVGGDVFTISTLEGSFEDNQSLLEHQPWWGDIALAAQFSTTLKGQLGGPNPTPFGAASPLFARALTTSGTTVFTSAWLLPFGIETAPDRGFSEVATYAVVEPVAPIPLPPAAFLLLGGLGALGLVKRRAGRAA